MERYAVIVAGGKGLRMQSDLPKQFMLLHDVPVLMHTLERFAQAFDHMHLVLVLPADHIPFWKNLCLQLDFDIEHTIVEGGQTRFHSVKNGLAYCPNDGVVGIHDGVRPLASEALIQRCYNTAASHGSGLPVVPVAQSLRKVEGDQNAAISRKGIMAVQTPQCFHLETIKAAFETDHKEAFTDDATVFEHAGHRIHLVDGEPTNIKLTSQADMKIAEAILSLSQSR